MRRYQDYVEKGKSATKSNPDENEIRMRYATGPAQSEVADGPELNECDVGLTERSPSITSQLSSALSAKRRSIDRF